MVSAGFSAPAAAFVPASEGVFNVPKPWGTSSERYRIIRHVESAIRATAPTATDPKPVILITTYLLDRAKSAQALIDACKRGVSVRVIIDEDIATNTSKRLIEALNGDNPGHSATPTANCGEPLPLPDGGGEEPLLTDQQALDSVSAEMDDRVDWGPDQSYVKRCQGSCRGAGGNMHSKFYAFSNSGGVDDVVMVSSSNLNRGGALNGWNDLYTMTERSVSFEAYKEIHRAMTDDDKAGDGKVEVPDGPYTSRFFPMRNADRSNDPTLEDLNKIRCRSAFGRTQIFVSMFYWAGARGEYLAAKLLNLARSGCRVSVIYGAPSLRVAEQLRNAARARLINLYDSRWDMNNDGYNEVRTHAKYVLVKGTFGGDNSAHMVMTGTQNWVAGSLSRGDEHTLNIARSSAYNEYLRNWNQIRNHSRRLPYNR